ncbi:MAG: hypothetical protein WDW38_006405 [Sanguina aurantia]
MGSGAASVFVLLSWDDCEVWVEERDAFCSTYVMLTFVDTFSSREAATAEATRLFERDPWDKKGRYEIRENRVKGPLRPDEDEDPDQSILSPDTRIPDDAMVAAMKLRSIAHEAHVKECEFQALVQRFRSIGSVRMFLTERTRARAGTRTGTGTGEGVDSGTGQLLRIIRRAIVLNTCMDESDELITKIMLALLGNS